MQRSSDFQKLIDDGCVHGWSYPERTLAEQFLLREGTDDELYSFRKMTSFIKTEEILSAANVQGFARALSRGLNFGECVSTGCGVEAHSAATSRKRAYRQGEADLGDAKANLGEFDVVEVEKDTGSHVLLRVRLADGRQKTVKARKLRGQKAAPKSESAAQSSTSAVSVDMQTILRAAANIERIESGDDHHAARFFAEFLALPFAEQLKRVNPALEKNPLKDESIGRQIFQVRGILRGLVPPPQKQAEATPPPSPGRFDYSAQWRASAELQREFSSAATYELYMQRVGDRHAWEKHAREQETRRLEALATERTARRR